MFDIAAPTDNNFTVKWQIRWFNDFWSKLFTCLPYDPVCKHTRKSIKITKPAWIQSIEHQHGFMFKILFICSDGIHTRWNFPLWFSLNFQFFVVFLKNLDDLSVIKIRNKLTSTSHRTPLKLQENCNRNALEKQLCE